MSSTFYKLCSSKNIKCIVMFTEAYLEPSHTSRMEPFCKDSGFNYFHKSAPSELFDWVLNMPLVYETHAKCSH